MRLANYWENLCGKTYIHSRVVRVQLCSILLGAVHKGIAKNWLSSSLVHKNSALTHPLPPCTCGHTINFEKFEVFCTKKCRRPHLKNPLLSCPHWTNPPSPLTANVIVLSFYQVNGNNERKIYLLELAFDIFCENYGVKKAYSSTVIMYSA